MCLGLRCISDVPIENWTAGLIMEVAGSASVNDGPASKTFWPTWANAQPDIVLIGIQTRMEIMNREIVDGRRPSSNARTKGVTITMSDEDQALAATAMQLNEDAKASRRRKPKEADIPEKDDAAELEQARAEQEAALEKLGAAVDDAENGYAENAEQQHTTAIDRMRNMGEEAVLSDRSLVFDVRDFLLDQIKSRPKPWSATSTMEQREIAAVCEENAETLIEKILNVIASRGEKSVRVLLTKINIGDDIVIAGKVKMADPADEDEAVTALHHARGKMVILTPASLQDYKSVKREAETMPDQPDFPFEAGSEHPDDDSDLAGPDDSDNDEAGDGDDGEAVGNDGSGDGPDD